MQRYNKSHKCCATCANWSGPRKIITSTKQVEVESSNLNAKCYDNVGGFVYGPPASWGGSCRNYRPAPGLN